MPTVNDSPCPRCAARGTLSLSETLEARPPGTYSLAGAGTKVSARARPVLDCAACGLHVVGDYDPDGRHVSFDPPPSPTPSAEDSSPADDCHPR